MRRGFIVWFALGITPDYRLFVSRLIGMKRVWTWKCCTAPAARSRWKQDGESVGVKTAETDEWSVEHLPQTHAEFPSLWGQPVLSHLTRAVDTLFYSVNTLAWPVKCISVCLAVSLILGLSLIEQAMKRPGLESKCDVVFTSWGDAPCGNN